LFRHNQHLSTTLASSHKEAELLRADGLLEHLNHLTAEAARLKQKAEKAKDYRTALAGVREMARLLELKVRVAVEQLTDVEILQILARGPGMTEAKFLRIARGGSPS
jgi:hypothetical protein